MEQPKIQGQQGPTPGGFKRINDWTLDVPAEILTGPMTYYYLRGVSSVLDSDRDQRNLICQMDIRRYVDVLTTEVETLREMVRSIFGGPNGLDGVISSSNAVKSLRKGQRKLRKAIHNGLQTVQRKLTRIARGEDSSASSDPNNLRDLLQYGSILAGAEVPSDATSESSRNLSRILEDGVSDSESDPEVQVRKRVMKKPTVTKEERKLVAVVGKKPNPAGPQDGVEFELPKKKDSKLVKRSREEVIGRDASTRSAPSLKVSSNSFESRSVLRDKSPVNRTLPDIVPKRTIPEQFEQAVLKDRWEEGDRTIGRNPDGSFYDPEDPPDQVLLRTIRTEKAASRQKQKTEAKAQKIHEIRTEKSEEGVGKGVWREPNEEELLRDEKRRNADLMELTARTMARIAKAKEEDAKHQFKGKKKK